MTLTRSTILAALVAAASATTGGGRDVGGSTKLQQPGLNMIPKDGGNRFSGVLFADFTKTGWQSDNLNDDLKARGLTNVAKVFHISDFNPGFGGPIKRDAISRRVALAKVSSTCDVPRN